MATGTKFTPVQALGLIILNHHLATGTIRDTDSNLIGTAADGAEVTIGSRGFDWLATLDYLAGHPSRHDW